MKYFPLPSKLNTTAFTAFAVALLTLVAVGNELVIMVSSALLAIAVLWALSTHWRHDSSLRSAAQSAAFAWSAVFAFSREPDKPIVYSSLGAVAAIFAMIAVAQQTGKDR